MAVRKLPKTEFAAAVAQIAGERKIEPESVIESVKLALVAAFKKDVKEQGEKEVDPEAEYKVKLDVESGGARIYLIKGKKEKDVTPPGFGRIATQTAKQVIVQKIREAEKEALFIQFESRIGSLFAGTILHLERNRIVVGLGKAEAIMPKREQIQTEDYQPGRRMTFLIKEIAQEEGRKEIIVSRADPNLVIELFRREVPEVSLGSVYVEKISRRAGKRSKVAVASNQPGVDPVGSCVGQKGIRVQEVIKELGEEKVDIIPFSSDPSQFILAALSPADGGEIVELDKERKQARVAIPDDQLALAIGSGGENIRSAGELVGYEIKVVSKSEIKGKAKVVKEGKEKVKRKTGKKSKDEKK
ncbi:transcription termination factor NusA [Candidatus Shapirobacteria bacterium]|nr:transcription termination factor NusA [Candidatus Shapirobacteria bacterium]